MSDLPFGFGPAPGDDDEDKTPSAFNAGPFAALFGGSSEVDLGSMLQQIGRLLSAAPADGSVSWELARDAARQAVSTKGDVSVRAATARQVEEAVRLAQLWLDPATTLPSLTSTAHAWSRAEWVENTLDGWREIIDPLAARALEASTRAMPTDVPPEMQAMAGPVLAMMRQMSGAMFGAQVGQGLGELAGEVLGASDVGFPLATDGVPALVPTNVAAFGEGLGVDVDEVRLYIALREAAHQRLFAHAQWLRPRIIAAVDEYARGITIDTSRVEETMRELDPGNPEALQQLMQSGLFEPPTTPAQLSALERLETLLALVEGWVDDVVDQAATAHLPTAPSLREALTRRRAAGGPVEATFATLVGLELRPRRLREAARLWAAIRMRDATAARDAVWDHPDLLPTTDDLDAPEQFAARVGSALDLSELDDLPAGPQEPVEAPGEKPEGRSDGNEPPAI